MTTPTGGDPLIRVRDARVVYRPDDVVALEGLTVDIRAGEIVGVLGPNGSGKTTFTKLLNGLLRPSSGSVVVDGRDTARRTVQDLARDVGYVFQNPNHQLFARTVAEELAVGPRAIGCPPDEVDARVADVSETFGLGPIMAAHPFRIGVPARKLVSIAAILAMRPRIVVLDEPTTGQDHPTSLVIERLIRRLGESGVTVICVTHDMPLIAHVADRAMALLDGRLIADGPPRDVFADATTMDRTRLAPPQITQLSMRLPGRVGSPVALSVDELVAAVRGAAPAAAG